MIDTNDTAPEQSKEQPGVLLQFDGTKQVSGWTSHKVSLIENYCGDNDNKYDEVKQNKTKNNDGCCDKKKETIED